MNVEKSNNIFCFNADNFFLIIILIIICGLTTMIQCQKLHLTPSGNVLNSNTSIDHLTLDDYSISLCNIPGKTAEMQVCPSPLWSHRISVSPGLWGIHMALAPVHCCCCHYKYFGMQDDLMNLFLHQHYMDEEVKLIPV